MSGLLCEFQAEYQAVRFDLQFNERKVDIIEEGFDIALRIGNLSSEFISNINDVLLQGAIRGIGIVIQPTFIAGPAIAAGKLEVILSDYEPETLVLYAVYAHRQLLSIKVRCFIDFIVDYYSSPSYWDKVCS